MEKGTGRTIGCRPIRTQSPWSVRGDWEGVPLAGEPDKLLNERSEGRDYRMEKRTGRTMGRRPIRTQSPWSAREDREGVALVGEPDKCEGGREIPRRRGRSADWEGALLAGELDKLLNE